MAKSRKRTDRKFKTLNVNRGKGGVRIDLDKYEAVKKAILLAVPRNMEGIAFKDLSRAVAARVPKPLFRGAAVSWYTTTVKLDLEASSSARPTSSPSTCDASARRAPRGARPRRRRHARPPRKRGEAKRGLVERDGR